MIEDYIKARKIGLKEVSNALSKGENPYPKVLSEEISNYDSLSKEMVGIKEVSSSLFCGTVNASRQNAFSRNFMPILEADSEFAYKWANLYDAQITEGIRDAVVAYEYMWDFYVLEGNKRVSVQRYLNVPSIMADIKRILPVKSEDEKVQIYYEFLDFYKCAPTYSLRFHKLGSYEKLAEYVGCSLKERWPSEVVHRLEAGYYRFHSVFMEKSGGNYPEHVADAFLIFLSVYSLDTILDMSRQVLRIRIQQMRKEFIVSMKQENILLLETPSEKKEDSKALSILRSILNTAPSYSEKNPLRAAFMYRYNPENSAWIADHEKGRKYIEEVYQGIVVSEKYDNLESDELLAEAIEEAILHGNKVIFTVSAEDRKETLKAAIKHPEIRFYNCSLNESHSFVPTYYGKVYEVKFLLGALAATACENHKIGYLADYPIYGTIANLNAFAIGAALIDPEVQIYLKWSTLENYDWRSEMIKDDIHVVSGHDITKPDWGEEELGLFKTNWDGVNHKLGIPLWNWGFYYDLILENILENQDEAKQKGDFAISYWYGINSGVMDVQLAEDLPYYTRKLIFLLREAIVSGEINPFSGEIHSQSAEIQPSYSPRLNNEDIIQMNWLNDNIIGSIPKESELMENARKIVKVSGVSGSREKNS